MSFFLLRPVVACLSLRALGQVKHFRLVCILWERCGSCHHTRIHLSTAQTLGLLPYASALQAGEAGWQLMDNTFGGAWEASKLPQPPMDLRIENSILQTVVIKGAIPTAGLTGDVETTAQFPIPNAQTTASAAAAPTIIVGQALDKPANSTANATAALIDPAAAVAAASAVVGPANTASGAAPAGAAVANVPTAPSSTAAVVPPEAAGAAQGGAPNPLTAAANADAGAADADMVTIDAHPAASSLPLSAAVSHKAAAGARRMLLQRK